MTFFLCINFVLVLVNAFRVVEMLQAPRRDWAGEFAELRDAIAPVPPMVSKLVMDSASALSLLSIFYAAAIGFLTLPNDTSAWLWVALSAVVLLDYAFSARRTYGILFGGDSAESLRGTHTWPYCLAYAAFYFVSGMIMLRTFFFFAPQ